MTSEICIKKKRLKWCWAAYELDNNSMVSCTNSKCSLSSKVSQTPEIIVHEIHVDILMKKFILCFGSRLHVARYFSQKINFLPGPLQNRLLTISSLSVNRSKFYSLVRILNYRTAVS